MRVVPAAETFAQDPTCAIRTARPNDPCRCGTDMLEGVVQPWPPVVLLAFADSDPSQPLPSLARERSQIIETLSPLQGQGRIELEVLANASVQSIVDTLRRVELRDRVRAFHFAGHASSKEVMLLGVDGSNSVTPADTLAAFLGKQQGLSLVVLNGCSTDPQVEGLIAAGIPSVVATSRRIGDAEAAELAVGLYAHLVTDPLGQAFDKAVAELSVLRPTRFRELVQTHDGMAASPWTLRGDREWRLVPEPYVIKIQRGTRHGERGYTVEIAPRGERWSHVQVRIPGMYPVPHSFQVYLGKGGAEHPGAVLSAPRWRVDADGVRALVWGQIDAEINLCIECQEIPERISFQADDGDGHELDLSHQSVLHRSVR